MKPKYGVILALMYTWPHLVYADVWEMCKKGRRFYLQVNAKEETRIAIHHKQLPLPNLPVNN